MYNGTPIRCCFLLKMEQALTPVLKKSSSAYADHVHVNYQIHLKEANKLIFSNESCCSGVSGTPTSADIDSQAVCLQQQRSSWYCHDIRVNWANETKYDYFIFTQLKNHNNK
jgi:hypothetical protein